MLQQICRSCRKALQWYGSQLTVYDAGLSMDTLCNALAIARRARLEALDSMQAQLPAAQARGSHVCQQAIDWLSMPVLSMTSSSMLFGKPSFKQPCAVFSAPMQ